MPLVFIPPTAPLRPAAIHRNHPGWGLFRHYRPWDAGINVWLLDDYSVTTTEPVGLDGVRRTFHGGHLHEVDELEAAALIAAGYELTET